MRARIVAVIVCLIFPSGTSFADNRGYIQRVGPGAYQFCFWIDPQRYESRSGTSGTLEVWWHLEVWAIPDGKKMESQSHS